MNRRQAIGTTLKAAAVASVLRTERAAAQDAGAKAPAEGSTIHLNPASGLDTNSGTQGSPLRSLAEAARRVNQSSGSGAMTVVLAEGIYPIGETTLLKPENRAFSKDQRLTIRAEVLPDDPEWHIGRMPTLVHTLPLSPTWNGRPDPLGGAANGMLVETSHVTIQGLKVLGMPVVESPRPGLIRRLYGISRLRRDLEDLEVAQCLFAGDEVTNPHHVAIIANGNGINVHHCVFRGLKISAVYWTPGSKGHAMTNCICHDLYGSGVWTSGIASDFEYRNNVVDSCNYVWTAQGGSSALADAAGRGGQQAGAAPTKPRSRSGTRSLTATSAAIEAHGERDGCPAGVQGHRSVGPGADQHQVRTNPSSWNATRPSRGYLHPVAGSDAAKVGAGLFTKPLA